MFNPTSLAQEIFGVLRSFNYTVNIFDFDGARVYEPSEARRFFASPRNITVSIFDDGENSSIKMFLSQSTSVTEVEGLIETMRNTASKFGVLFNVRKYQRELVPKDLSPSAHIDSEVGTSVVRAGNDKETKSEIVHLDSIKSELKQLIDEFPEVLAHLRANKKKKNEKVKKNMNETTLEENKGPPMMELPALGCSVEIAEWNDFKDGSLKLYGPPAEIEQSSDGASGMGAKLKAIADKVAADGMANMFRRVADAIDHGASDAILITIANKAIALAYSKLEETALVETVEHNGVGTDALTAEGLVKTSKTIGGSTTHRYYRDRELVATVSVDSGLINKAIDMFKGRKVYPFTASLDNASLGKSDMNCTSLYSAETWIIDAIGPNKQSIIVTESIRDFGKWFDSMSFPVIFESLGPPEPHEYRIHSHIENDDMASAMDIAYDTVKDNFDPTDFLDQDDDIDFNNPSLSYEEKNLDCSDVRSSLKYYLQNELDYTLEDEYTPESEVYGLADTLLPQVLDVMTKAGWVIDNCEKKDIEEDIDTGQYASQEDRKDRNREPYGKDCKAGDILINDGTRYLVISREGSGAKIKRLSDNKIGNLISLAGFSLHKKALDEDDTKLATEDVLLPKNAKDDLTREVRSRRVEGDKDADVARILSLAKGKSL